MDEPFSAWRSQISQQMTVFAPLFAEDTALDPIFGIAAAAVLWPVRDAAFNPDQQGQLQRAAGDAAHMPHLLKALGGWDQLTPAEAVRSLDKRQRGDEALRAALTAVMGTFIQELLAAKALERQPAHIAISGSVSGGNVVIGGVQVVAGDLVIQHVRQQVSTCPKAPKPPDHFTGRVQELQDLRDALTGGERVAITAVRSMGGMGKTTLAMALCHHPDKPFDAVLWAAIGQTPNPTETLREWARYAVDDYALPANAEPEQIAGWVRGQLTQLGGTCGRRWLVVFDDVWNTQACYDAVALLQKALPADTRTLITTRQTDTAAQLQARSIELYELTNADALALLHRLRDSRHVSDAHLQRTVDLIKGHPLTLEIAIASLNQAEDPADVEATLDDYARGIAQGSPFDALDAETPRSLSEQPLLYFSGGGAETFIKVYFLVTIQLND